MRKKKMAPKHITSSVKHQSLVFIGDANADNWINSKLYRDILPAHIQSDTAKLVERNFTVHADNDPKQWQSYRMFFNG